MFSGDPSPVIGILENLKSDTSPFVRKSVANNMNDFLKENYDETMLVLKRWRMNASNETRWVIKHALRNEIKKNNEEALTLVR
ncbi:MAG: hypothetical protein ACPGYT_04570 [Nitrospirales bacterium]